MPASTPLPPLRHIERCHNISLPAGRTPLTFKDDIIGWVDPSCISWLKTAPCHSLVHIEKDHITLSHKDNLRDISNALVQQKRFNPFNEWFDVRSPKGDILGQIDRALIPILGVEASGVHMNGLVQKKEGLHLWVARRSPHKRLDPGKLDHLVAGGMSTGLTPDETIIKEAEEEAAIPAHLARQAKQVSRLHYAMSRPEGLRRDCLYCYDLILPESFTPRANDGEVESFHLLPIKEVFQQVWDTDDFKFNVNLVLLDLFLRLKMFNKQDAQKLAEALY